MKADANNCAEDDVIAVGQLRWRGDITAASGKVNEALESTRLRWHPVGSPHRYLGGRGWSGGTAGRGCGDAGKHLA